MEMKLPKDNKKAFAIVFTMLAEERYARDMWISYYNAGVDVDPMMLCKIGEELIEKMNEVERGWARGYISANYNLRFGVDKQGMSYIKAKDSHPFWTREDVLFLIDELLENPTDDDWNNVLKDILEDKDN